MASLMREVGVSLGFLLPQGSIFQALLHKKGNQQMRMHTIEHVPFKGPGAVAQYAGVRGHVLTRTRLFIRVPLPAIEEVDLFVIMGGPISVHDEDRFQWRSVENRFLSKAGDARARIVCHFHFLLDSAGSRM